MIYVPLFTISIIAALHVNFSFIKKVLWVPPSHILTMANPYILSINRAVTFINLCSLGFKIMWSIGKIGNDLFQKFETAVS